VSAEQVQVPVLARFGPVDPRYLQSVLTHFAGQKQNLERAKREKEFAQKLFFYMWQFKLILVNIGIIL
jgi:hypothetical protein